MERPGLTLLLIGRWRETRRRFVTTSVGYFIDTVVERVKHLLFTAILIAVAAEFFFTPTIYCYLLLQSLEYGHYYALVKTI